MKKIAYASFTLLVGGTLVWGCKSDNAAPSTTKQEVSAIAKTEPLVFRIDGMRRVNGAL